MNEEMELIDSPLTQTHHAEGHTLRIQIYRSPDDPWVLEIVDELGTSTVWNDAFDTDTDIAALEGAFLAIGREGAHRFVTSAQHAAREAEPGLLQRLAQIEQPPSGSTHDMMAPLVDEELDELDRLLLDLDGDESMTLDMLDGFLHALAIGPETVMPGQWLPKVWGQEDGAMMPPVGDMDQVNHLPGLVMRHFNSILSGFAHHPPMLAPLWSTARYDAEGEFEDAEMWAYGFTEGVKLSRAAWQALFDHKDGRRWYRPIGLLGDDKFSADQDELTRTPAQCAALAAEIEESLTRLHAFWLPLRRGVAAAQQTQGERPPGRPKVGYRSSQHEATPVRTKVAAMTPAPAAVARSSRSAVAPRSVGGRDHGPRSS